MLNRYMTAQYIWKLRKKILHTNNKILKRILMWKYEHKLIQLGAYIPLSTKFLDVPTFPHGLSGVMISQAASIGSGCTIFHQVTIGSNTFSDSKYYGSPVIGDNVYIGSGAKVVGGVKVGNNVRIGANCVVSEDVPDNCTVVLEKPRVIIHDKMRNNIFKEVQIEK